jgi:peroxiredoxin
MKQIFNLFRLPSFCLAFACLFSLQSKASNGYLLHLTIDHPKDSVLQICHFYGKPERVNIDTTVRVKMGEKTTLTIKSTKRIVGGLYMLLFKNKPSQLEIVLNNGDEMTIHYDFNKPVETAEIKGTQECLDYLQYQKYLLPFNQQFKQLDEDRRKARTKADSSSVKQRTKDLNTKMDDYREAYAKKNPNGFMTKLFKASKYKEIPANILGNEEKEHKFIREHIWDGFDFADERLAYTPFYENKLANYLSVVPQIPDTINTVSDELLSRMKNARELYKLTVDWMVRSQENVKARFGDDCFIYVVEKYYLNGKADWINDSTKNSYMKKIAMLSKNVIGAKASDFTIKNEKDQVTSLRSIYAAHAYTVLIFWSPTCNHCTDEVPLLDSAVASLGKDIVVVGVDAHAEGPAWKKWIQEHKFKANWVHLYDQERKASYVSDYSVYTTPVIYLIDRKGTIVGKRITNQNLKQTFEDLAGTVNKK